MHQRIAGFALTKRQLFCLLTVAKFPYQLSCITYTTVVLCAAFEWNIVRKPTSVGSGLVRCTS